MDKCIPKIKINLVQKVSPRWMNAKLKRVIQNKSFMYQLYLTTKTEVTYNKYIETRNISSNKCIRKAKRNYKQRIANDSRTNPKHFWKYIQNKTKRKTGISPLQLDNCQIVITNGDTVKTVYS